MLDTLARFFEERNAPFAVIGGVALATYSLSRTTMDLDLVVDGHEQDAAIAFLESLGYETLYRSSGYSNHVHSSEELGRVDFVYVSGSTSETLFAATKRLDGPDGREIPVPAPEHLVAMKVLAMKNDPSRRFREMADIRSLLDLPGVDREYVRRQFAKHGLEERFRELEEDS